MHEYPFISAVLPCRNEAGFIKRCLDSIVISDYPKERLEVLVVDGMSEDGTRGIIKEFVGAYNYVHLIDNARRITPCAINIGIRRSKGEAILRMDVHAVYSRDYISKCVKYLREYGADNVGGIMVTLPRKDTFMGRAIVKALSHHFGVGSSAFRTGADRPLWVDTVFGGCYGREIFDKVGLFNEGLPRGQDMEFNIRLKKAGGRTLLMPDIVSYYYARSDAPSFVRHNFINGAWAILPILKSPIMPVLWRHLVPLAFITALAFLLALTAVLPSFFFFPVSLIGAYIAASLWFSIVIGVQEKNLRLILAMPLVFSMLHFAYGLGSLYGLAKLLSTKEFWTGRIRMGLKMKRLFDILFSATGLAIASPVFLIIASMIKKEDGGPVFYRGLRIGKDGKPFRIFKFRSMVLDADKVGGPSTSDDDPRITKTGRLIRKYKLDELPQLINVFKGEMSFVGPRPEVPSEVDTYSEEERKIFSVCPGITDWASITYHNEGEILKGCPDPHVAYREKIRPGKLKLAMKYVEEASFATDMKIIFSTIATLIKTRV